MAAPESHESAASCDNMARTSSHGRLLNFKQGIPSPTLRSWSQVSDSQRSIGPTPDFEGRPAPPRKLDILFSKGEAGGSGLVLTSLQERDTEIQETNKGWMETLRNRLPTAKTSALITASGLLLLFIIPCRS